VKSIESVIGSEKSVSNGKSGQSDHAGIHASEERAKRGKHDGAQFTAARDSRNRRVSGLYTRNGRFYALLWADRADGRKTARRFPLRDENNEVIRNLTAAKDALDVLRANRRENALPHSGLKPGFDAFSAEYLSMSSTKQKRERTQEKESGTLVLWKAHLADTRIDRISTPIIPCQQVIAMRYSLHRSAIHGAWRRETANGRWKPGETAYILRADIQRGAACA